MTRETVTAERVVLAIPGKAEYIGVTRLAAAGIAYRLRLPLDDSEDLKLAITEACSYILSKTAAPIEINWTIERKCLKVKVSAEKIPHENASDQPSSEWSDIGLFLINSLTDATRHVETDTEITLEIEKHFPRRGDE